MVRVRVVMVRVRVVMVMVRLRVVMVRVRGTRVVEKSRSGGGGEWNHVTALGRWMSMSYRLQRDLTRFSGSGDGLYFNVVSY